MSRIHTLNSYYQIIHDDLVEADPISPMVMPLPYNENRSLEDNVEQMFQYLFRALKRKDRLLSLVNAYYLGQVLENRPKSPRERSACCRKLTPYYQLCCLRIYTIFEPLGIEQIYRTRQAKVNFFRKINEAEVRRLSEEAVDRFSQEFEI